MNYDMAMQLIRYTLLTLGPLVVSRGLATDEQWAQIVGAVIVVATWAWGIYVKKGTTSVPDATAARADVPTVSPLTGQTKP
jgi:hypothetical protein